MPRAIWSGAISFGLVNVPIKLFSAISRKDVRFNQLHESDGGRIQQKRVCAKDGEEVPYEEIVKGFEIAPDRYVVVTPDELAALAPRASRMIDIEEFVDLDEIDPVYFESAYYLLPDKGAAKAYALLHAAMAETNKVAIGRMVLRTKEYLAAIRATGPVLALSTMLFADEVVPPESLDGVGDETPDVSARERQMAEQLIESLSADFEPAKYRDEYRQRVLDLIEAKAEGATLVAQPEVEETAKVTDLLAALEASLSAAKDRATTKPEPAKKRRAATKK